MTSNIFITTRSKNKIKEGQGLLLDYLMMLLNEHVLNLKKKQTII